MKRAWLGPALGLVFCSPAIGQDPVPVGDQFQVNTYTTDFQAGPSVAMGPEGDFVVAWDSDGSYGTDSDYQSIQARIFAADGTPSGGEFQVNTATTGFQRLPSVALLPGGDFVVAWLDIELLVDGYSIQAQRFLADGTSDGGQFRVNMYPGDGYGDVGSPAVASGPDGSFLVVWEGRGFGDDTSDSSIQGQRFSSTGALLGSQFQANTYTTSGQRGAAAAVGPAGEFVVVWSSSGSSGTDTWGYSVQGRRFAADGTPAGDDFQVNTYTTLDQSRPTVTVAPDGGFLVTWSSVGSSGSDNFNDGSVQARRFAADGTPVGDDFQVNTYTTGFQTSPVVATDGDGEFVVVWSSAGSSGSDTDSGSIQTRRLASDGTPVGSDFQVNGYTPSYQRFPSLAAASDGRFVASWTSSGSGGTDSEFWSIQAQRFVPDCDGFGGDTDGDGVCDDFDLCPGFDDTLDGDGDGVPDGCDLCLGDDATGDSDGDGVCDDLDLCPGFDDGEDADGDGVPDGCDVCPGFDDTLDGDGDGVPDGCDLCLGDDATGDSDGDGVCADTDCDDSDPDAQSIDACGVCGGDNSTCSIFANGFESGDTSAWTVP